MKILIRILRSPSLRRTNLTIFREMATSTRDVETIRGKFEKYVYLTDRLPELLSMDNKGVYVNPRAPSPDVVDTMERRHEMPDNVKMPKLKAKSMGEWGACVQKVPQDYFKSRDTMDELEIEERDREVNKHCIRAARISMRKALESIFVTLSCDMDFYVANRTELEADLSRKLSPDEDLNNKQVVKRLEQELFYATMCKIFGSPSTDDKIEMDGKEVLYDKSFMLKDFRVLSYDGNKIRATAERDNYYLVFMNMFG